MHIIFDLDDAQQHVTTSCLDMLEPEIIHGNKVIVYKSCFELLSLVFLLISNLIHKLRLHQFLGTCLPQ